jgi:hypothetical protein
MKEKFLWMKLMIARSMTVNAFTVKKDTMTHLRQLNQKSDSFQPSKP